jgi:hypothetical protein
VSTREFVRLVFSELGREPRLRVMRRALLALLATVNPTLRAVREVAYQLEQPFVLDHSKFGAAFGPTRLRTPKRSATRSAGTEPEASPGALAKSWQRQGPPRHTDGERGLPPPASLLLLGSR